MKGWPIFVSNFNDRTQDELRLLVKNKENAWSINEEVRYQS